VKKKLFFLIFLIQILFSPEINAQRSASFVQDSIQAIKIHTDGITLGRMGDYEKAINTIDGALAIYKKIYGNNSPHLSLPYINIGIQYKNLRNLEKAIEYYKKAEMLLISAHGENYPLLGTIYINIGNIYRLKGDYTKALEYQENAFHILQLESEKYNDNFQSAKYNIAELQLKLGHSEKAIQFALDNLNSTLPRFRPSLNDLIALGYRNTGKFDLANKYYLNSINSWIKLYGESNVELIDEYLAYSDFFSSQKQCEDALNYTRKAQSLVLKFFGEKSASNAQVQSNFGDYFYYKTIKAQKMDDFNSQKKDNLHKSIQYYQKALVALVDSFNIQNPMVDPPLRNILSEIQLLEVLKKKANAMEKLGDAYLSEFDNKNAEKYFIGCLSSLTNATHLIHRLRIGFENEESRLFLAENQESTFHDAINICYKLYQQNKQAQYVNLAFEFSEKGRSANLLASVRDVKATEFGGIPDSLLKKMEYLKVNISNYTSKLFEENHSAKPDSQRVNLFTSKIFKFNREHDRLVKYFEKTYPQYYSFKYENKIADIKEIQSKLRFRDALIEYVVDQPSDQDKGKLYRFVITKNTIDFSGQTIDQGYVKEIDYLHQFLTSSNYLNTKKKDFVHYSLAAYSMYQTLLQPVAGLIKGKDLTIVPDGKLAYIPFDALLSEMPDTSTMNFRDLKYLVRDFAINYSYSSTLLFDFQNQSKKGSQRLVAFSPEYKDGEIRLDKESSGSYVFSPLPGAADEVKNISQYISTTAFDGRLAQENTFKEKAVDFDILHLAMHTIVNDSLPMLSKLVFSSPEKNSVDDGFLNTYEIYNMKLKARLAVLSACETGSGKLQKGEGVMSLARGFIFAGCPSIVMTLWQVEDKSGAEIMRNFYAYLSKGKRKDEALQMAKLKHLELSDPLTAHPHYWLGYVNIGNPEPLYTSKDVYFIVFLFVIVLLVYFDWYYRRKKPR
jgi:CHAT domain-containing protein